MKKLMFVAVLCISILIANAQEKQSTMKQGTKIEKMGQKAERTPIKEAELMQPIKDDLAKNFAGAKVVRAVKLDNKGVITYRVVIMKDNEKWALTYDNEGKFLKKAEMKEKEMKGKKGMKKTEEAPKM